MNAPCPVCADSGGFHDTKVHTLTHAYASELARRRREQEAR